MNRLLAAISLVLVFGLQATYAHHSLAGFDGEVVELAGELLAVDWRNPHPTFRFRPVDGSLEELQIQAAGSVNSLTETGVSREMFKVGDRITIAGRSSVRRPDRFLGTHVMLPSGLEVVLDYGGEPRWSGDHVGGRDMAQPVDEAVLARAAARAATANKGIFRVWSVPSQNSAGEAGNKMISGINYTEAAQTAQREYRRPPIDDPFEPRSGCTPMPAVMFLPEARQFADHGDHYTLYLPHNGGVLRTIWLDEIPADVDRAPSRLGTSVGHWEGDTLIVETAEMSSPFFGNLESLDTSQRTVVERFTLSADQARLGYELVISDPVAFVSPVTYSYEYLALEEEIGTDVCVMPGE